MKTSFRTLASLAFILGLALAACGDKIIVPADKSGKCTAGLLTKCGDSCVDLQTDLGHCGACGKPCNTGAGEICRDGKCTAACPPSSTRCMDKCVDTSVSLANCGMCGKQCGPTEICAKGTCAPTCEAVGYTTCAGMNGMLDAGGATSCVDVTSDSNNCGACGNKCAMGACTNGVCCPTGQTGCNGKCASLQADANNCGTCGTVCGMTAPNCVVGQCSKCKPDILILSDGQTGINQNIGTVFKNAGFRPTVVDKGSTQYAGMPAATDFGAVFILPGADYNQEMLATGQTAIVNAQAAGVGVVFDGFSAYKPPNYNQYNTLRPLMLLQYVSGGFYQPAQITTPTYQPWFAGINGTAFTSVNPMQWFQYSVVNGGMQVATNTTNGVPAEAVRAMPNGRIVHFGYCPNYQAAANAWTNDPNTAQWTINGVRWAAGCTN
jgi:hypothetical protein